MLKVGKGVYTDFPFPALKQITYGLSSRKSG
jgi:hypothetical protein